MPQCPIVIIGGGLAGLACALRLQEKRVECIVLEASDAPGGRVRTDLVNGFRLDRGFQVLLTAYPRTQQTIDYAALRLKNFHAGALVRWRKQFHAFADPTRRPAQALKTLLSPFATMPDVWRVMRLRDRVCSPPVREVLEHPESTTIEYLNRMGFSKKLIEAFFKPFLGGIFLEPELETSSRKFEFVFRMFSLGQAALPAFGMGAIPEQMAAKLRPDMLRLNTKVAAVKSATVHLSSGESIIADKVVIATEHSEALRLMGQDLAYPGTSVTCLYYAAPVSPVNGPWLVLNGENSGPINNLAVPTELHTSYAPTGVSLVSVTVLDTAYQTRADIEDPVRSQLSEWYGAGVSAWRHLRTDRISPAVPLQQPPLLTPVEKPVRLSEKIYLCGDHTGIASIEGAIASGLRAADALSG